MKLEYWVSEYGLAGCKAHGMPRDAIYLSDQNWYRIVGTWQPIVHLVGNWPSEDLRMEVLSRDPKVIYET